MLVSLDCDSLCCGENESSFPEKWKELQVNNNNNNNNINNNNDNNIYFFTFGSLLTIMIISYLHFNDRR